MRWIVAGIALPFLCSAQSAPPDTAEQVVVAGVVKSLQTLDACQAVTVFRKLDGGNGTNFAHKFTGCILHGAVPYGTYDVRMRTRLFDTGRVPGMPSRFVCTVDQRNAVCLVDLETGVPVPPTDSLIRVRGVPGAHPLLFISSPLTGWHTVLSLNADHEALLRTPWKDLSITVLAGTKFVGAVYVNRRVLPRSITLEYDAATDQLKILGQAR